MWGRTEPAGSERGSDPVTSRRYPDAEQATSEDAQTEDPVNIILMVQGLCVMVAEMQQQLPSFLGPMNP